MPVIDLNKVVGLWTGEDIRNWTFGEKAELVRLLISSMELSYREKRL